MTEDEDRRTPGPGSADATPRMAPHLRVGEVRQGSKPGTRYVRVTSTEDRPFRRTGATRWEATLAAQQPHTRLGRWLTAARYAILGMPLATSRSMEQRLSKLKALAVFSSDALSSTAYATEEMLLVLVLVGAAHLYLALPVSITIVALMLMVVVSYRQAIRAYPKGGGAYAVARENLGLWPGVIAAASLMVDYILTVAVSVSAGVAAITSFLPELLDYRVEMALVFVALLSLGNLRGLRESGTIFAVPTYVFLLAFGSMLVAGVARLAFGDTAGSLAQSAPPREAVAATGTLGLFIVLRAFSSGATALTGVEAIADGVPAFKPPEARNASTTLFWMGGILAVFFVGATFLAVRFGVVPLEHETVISQIGRIAFGGENVMYYLLQIATALVLVLAANTAFNGFPILASILARDGFVPHQFAFRGDRLAFTNGIFVLAGVAGALLVAFNADTHRLIPLYAVGVFISFTLSQSGLVLRWWRMRPPGWRTTALINGTGALATGVVTIIVVGTKFTHGAWVVLILIPFFALILRQIRRHYTSVSQALSLDPGQLTTEPLLLPPDRPIVVPIGGLNRASLRAIAYARGTSTNVTAVHVVTDEDDDTSELEERWQSLLPDVPLVILESPYRSFQAPFIAYIDALDIPRGMPLTVVVAEFAAQHWWQFFLHNQTALRLLATLRTRPNTIVVDVIQQLGK